MAAPGPPSLDASSALLTAFSEYGIAFRPNESLTGLDPSRRVASFAGGGEMPYDLFLEVPVHQAPEVVAASGLRVDGWVLVDAATLETSYDGVYAIGDVTNVGTPKAGAFAEGRAAVVADAIIARARGEVSVGEYGGSGACSFELGSDRVARVEITFARARPPVGRLEGPSHALAAEKDEFGASRVRRWFGGG